MLIRKRPLHHDFVVCIRLDSPYEQREHIICIEFHPFNIQRLFAKPYRFQTAQVFWYPSASVCVPHENFVLPTTYVVTHDSLLLGVWLSCL